MNTVPGQIRKLSYGEISCQSTHGEICWVAGKSQWGKDSPLGQVAKFILGGSSPKRCVLKPEIAQNGAATLKHPSFGVASSRCGEQEQDTVCLCVCIHVFVRVRVCAFEHA